MKPPARMPEPAASVPSTASSPALSSKSGNGRDGRRDRECKEPEPELRVVVPGCGRREDMRGDEDVEDPVREPVRAPGSVGQRRDAVTSPIRPHTGEELC